jgi:hypothetical protein
MSMDKDYQLLYDASNDGFSSFKEVVSTLLAQDNKRTLITHLEAILLNLFQSSYNENFEVLDYIYNILFYDKQKKWRNTINKTICEIVTVPSDNRWTWLKTKMLNDPLIVTMILNNDIFLSKSILVSDFIITMEETLKGKELADFYKQMRQVIYLAFFKCNYSLIETLLSNGISQYCVETENKDQYISGLFIMPCFSKNSSENTNSKSKYVIQRCMMNGLDINAFVTWKGKETNLLFHFIETFNMSGVEMLTFIPQVEYEVDGKKHLLSINFNIVHPQTGYTPLLTALIKLNTLTTHAEHIKLRWIILHLINSETDINFTTSSGIDIPSFIVRSKDKLVSDLIQNKINFDNNFFNISEEENNLVMKIWENYINYYKSQINNE